MSGDAPGHPERQECLSSQGKALGKCFQAQSEGLPGGGCGASSVSVVQRRRMTLGFLLASVCVLRTSLSPLPSPPPLFPPQCPFFPVLHSHKAFVQNDTTPAVRQDGFPVPIKGCFFKTFSEFHKSLQLSKAVISSKEATSTRYIGKFQ